MSTKPFAIVTLLLAAIAPAASAATADRLIPAHGPYSQAYQADWSTVPTVKALATAGVVAEFAN